MAELKQRWRTLQYVTLSPNRIGAITKAALVLSLGYSAELAPAGAG